MSLIRVTTRSGAPEDTAADTRVVGLFEGEGLADERLQRLVELGEAKGGLKKVAVAHEDAPGGGQRRVLIAGLGKRDEFDAERARVAAAAAAGRAKELGDGVAVVGRARRATASRPGWSRARCSSCTRFDRFKSANDDGDGGSSRSSWSATTDAEVEARGAWRPRRPTPPATCRTCPRTSRHPTFLAERAGEIADEHESLEVELLDREAIVANGMGAFAAVAQGSVAEPRLIVLRYRPPAPRAPTSASSARPSPSTPAGSRSSPRRRCRR